MLGLPSVYDLRTLGKVTPVKDQGSAESCWTFGTYASLESCLLLTEDRDFSENNLKNNHGFDSHPNDDGGNAFMSTAYLLRWSGPINESDDPYDPYTTTSPLDLTAQKHVQEVLRLPDRNKDQIKNAIISYGAVSTAMCWDTDIPEWDFGVSSFNDDKDAYWYYLSDALGVWNAKSYGCNCRLG